MNGLEKDTSTDKIKLIYEFNNLSSLFARVAYAEIDRGNYLEAIRILESGMMIHPGYPTAHFVLAIANAYAGRNDEAVTAAKSGCEMMGSNEPLEHYQKKIDEILTERNSLSESKRTAFIEEERDIIPEEIELDEIEDKLDLLAQKLSKAKIVPKTVESTEEPAIPEFSGKKIVSETLADIFFSQKNYEQSIAIYEQLIEQKPEKAEFYLQRISEIKLLL